MKGVSLNRMLVAGNVALASAVTPQAQHRGILGVATATATSKATSKASASASAAAVVLPGQAQQQSKAPVAMVSVGRRRPHPGLSIPPGGLGPTPPGMAGGVQVGVPFGPAALAEIERTGAKRVFVLANRSSVPLVADLVSELGGRGVLAAPLCSAISMGAGEEGLLEAANAASAANADCVVTVGGGAVQDAGKLIRLWLAGQGGAAGDGDATTDGIKAALALDPVPPLPPQICLPNSFAMAELSSVAGMTLRGGIKSGASHPSLMPTAVVFDSSLSSGLPDWVRYGTALRCIEHAVGAITHPQADDEIRDVALRGLRSIREGLEAMVSDPTSPEAAERVYVGGWCALRALNTNSCYPALGHLIGNMYSARFGVHQGSCSGILCGRVLAYHADGSREGQERIASVLSGASDGGNKKSAARLVAELVATLPGVSRDHAEVGVGVDELTEFAESRPLDRLNKLSPVPFADSADVLTMLGRSLEEL